MKLLAYTREGRVFTVKFPPRTAVGKKLVKALEEFRAVDEAFFESEIMQISAEWGEEEAR